MHKTPTSLKTILVLGLAIALGAAPVLADDDDYRRQGPGLSAQDQVEDLPVCYALGTDALGRAVNAIGDQPLDSTANLDDPDFAEGLAFYRKCFAKGFSFTLEVDGNPLLTVPDPATRTDGTDAALEWANFVNNAFRGPQFRNTQHHMGSITSSVRGNRGTVQSYLIATHAYAATAAMTGVRIVGGTYNDDVIRKRGRWLIAQRTLNITSNVELPAGLQ